MTLSTTRYDMLDAVIEALAEASAARLVLLRQCGTRISRKVIVTGGVQEGLGNFLYRDWGGGWKFRPVEEATLLGLGTIQPR